MEVTNRRALPSILRDQRGHRHLGGLVSHTALRDEVHRVLALHSERPCKTISGIRHLTVGNLAIGVCLAALQDHVEH
eukprot:11371626-Alexandrium_andersonii.AAC.1